MLPHDGKVLVQCKGCNRTFFKAVQPARNEPPLTSTSNADK
jgi:hypothetical protein